MSYNFIIIVSLSIGLALTYLYLMTSMTNETMLRKAMHSLYKKKSYESPQDDDRSTISNSDSLNDYSRNEISDIDLKRYLADDKIGLIEVNNVEAPYWSYTSSESKEKFYPLNLYSSYYDWAPAEYQKFYYPMRRYIRPYHTYFYPGSWRRHYGNYYYIID